MKEEIKKVIQLLDPIDLDTYGDNGKDFQNRCAIDKAIEILEKINKMLDK